MKRTTYLLVVVTLALGLAAPSAVAQPTNFRAVLSGADEVPSNDSLGRGFASFQLSPDGTELDYRLVVANINNVIAAHIHVAPPDVNGPVVAFLFGPAAPGEGRVNGVIAQGTITAANLTGPLAGQSLSELISAIEDGETYVNVHTSDGDPTTTGGPGDLPGGEIRGQIF